MDNTIKPLNILMIAPQFQPLIGGYERASARLSSELASRGHKVTILTERRSRKWLQYEQTEGYEIRRLWCWYRPVFHTFTSITSFMFYLFFFGHRYQIFHIHQYGKLAALSIALGHFWGRPIVLKITSSKQEGIARTLANNTQFMRHLLVRFHRNVDAYIVTSSETFQEVIEFGIPKERIHLIPNGVDTDLFKPCNPNEKNNLRKQLTIKHAFVVLYCSSLFSVKNPDGLLIAWRFVKNRVSDAVLCIVGDGPLGKVMEAEIASFDLEDSVKMVGQQVNVLSWYQVADLFVLPSHFEGLSNSLLEALSCGLPVVSTSVSGSTDVFKYGNVGEIIGDFHTETFSLAILKLVSNQFRLKECAANARDVAVKHYSIKAVANKTEALYTSLVNKQHELLKSQSVVTFDEKEMR